jgi:hypothetical protein
MPVTPHTTSAFAIFGYAGFAVLLMLENWFVFRPHRAAAQQKNRRPRLVLSRVVARRDVSEKAMRMTEAGWPSSAYLLRTDCGCVDLSSVRSSRANGLPISPAVFLFSAIISGTALLVVPMSSRAGCASDDLRCLKGWR